MTVMSKIELPRTERVMRGLVEKRILDTYTILVKVRGSEGFLHSENSNRETLYDIASIGKVAVTAPLVLHAVGEGRLSLEDPLERFFEGVPEDKRGITVAQLLLHTSGILREYEREAFYPEIRKGKDAMARFILGTKLGFAPGTHCAYSCFGYLLLGFIVEKVYGKRLDAVYEDEIRSRLGFGVIFNPALDTPNMAETHYRAEIGDCACADDIVYEMKGVAGNGASFCSVGTMQKMVDAWMARDERLYSRALFEASEKNYTPALELDRGLGWQIVMPRYAQTGGLFAPGSFGHAGNTGTSVFMSREQEMSVILFTNATRQGYKRTQFERAEYEVTMAMREQVHGAIREDLVAQNMG